MSPLDIQPNGFTPAPAWSLQAGDLGRFCVLAGALLFMAAAFLMFFRKSKAGSWAFVLGTVGVLGAFGILASLFLGDQFQFQYVAEHSWKDIAAPYKIAAMWSGQQGSFLLWATTSSIFGLLTLRGTGEYRRWFIVVYALFLGSLCGILCYETPYALVRELAINGTQYSPANGRGLVPSLQNYWVVIHPPVIFLGFGSLTVLFAYAMSAMLTGNLKAWIPQVRPWALVSLSILGMGLVMGGLWAYETQGWGGFWAWDPVENVSLVPWLFVAASVHGMIVQTTRSRWAAANVLLAGLPFLLYFYGTFLTRSGFLDKFSVHSFAEMNRSALWILLAALVIGAAAFFILWFSKGLGLAKAIDTPVKKEGFAREAAYQSGVLLLSALSIAVAIGMSTPLLAGIMGKSSKVVEEPLYHQVTVWFFVPIMVLMAIGPFLSWKRMPFREFMSRFMAVLGLAVLVTGAFYFVGRTSWSTNAMLDFPFGLEVPRVPWVMFLFFISALAVIGNLWRLAESFKRSKMGIGGFVAHLGAATLLAGLVLSRGLERKEQALVMRSAPATAMGYTISVEGMTSNPFSDRDNRVEFKLASVGASGNDPAFTASPRFFYTTGEDGQPEAFTGPHVERRLSHDIYVALGRPLTSLWDEPQHFDVGETKIGEGVSITYLGLARHGAAGQSGTAFGARLKVIEDGKTYYGEPKITLGSGPDDPQVSPSLRATLAGMDASDRSIMLQMPYTQVLFPLEVYYKPMTILIWIGTAIMFLGGLLSALYRRKPSAE